jgi:hypothetical protein
MKKSVLNCCLAFSIIIKKIQGLSCDFGFLGFIRIIFYRQIMDRVYGSWDHGWLLVHSGLVTMGRHDRSGAQKIVVIARREREEVIGVLTNGATWR